MNKNKLSKLVPLLLGGVGVGKAAVVKRKIIQYDPKLKTLARKLRQNLTFSEVKLWNELKTGQMMCYDFDRQRPIGKYIVDFYCKDLFLVIEIDGLTHDDEAVLIKDEVRQKELESLGVLFFVLML